MKRIHPLPETDLDKLREEVLARGSAAALPRNLSNRWLLSIARDINRSRKANMEGRYDDSGDALAAPVMLVTSLIAEGHKMSVGETRYTFASLMHGLRVFETAVAEEIVARNTGIFVYRHTLEDIG